jgi:hypothetical protein
MRLVNCILFGFLVAGAVFLVVPSTGSASGLTLSVLLLNVALIAAALFFNLTSGQERAAEYYCYLYLLLFFLIPGYIHTSTGNFPFFSMVYADSYMLMSAICVLMFSAFFFIGYSFVNGYQSKPRFSQSNSRPNASVGYELPLIYTVISVVVAVGFGINKYVASRWDAEELIPETTPAVLIALTAPRILSFVAVLICFLGLRNRLSLAGIVILLPVFAVFAVLNSPIAIPRFILFAYIIIFITVFFELTKRRKIALLSLFVIGQFTIFPAVSLLSRGDIQDLFSTSLLDFFVSNGDFDGFQSTINVVRYAEDGGYHWGVNFLSALLFFFPRDLWAGKSRGTGGESAAFNGYDFVNISAPLPSEFFVDFGLVGVAFGAALFGAMLARIDGQIHASRGMPDKLQLFCPATIVGYLFIILRGSLVGVMGPVVLTYSIVWLSTKVIEFRRRMKFVDRHDRNALNRRRANIDPRL